MGLVIGYYASTQRFSKNQVLKAESNSVNFKIYNTIDDLFYSEKMGKETFVYEVELLSFIDMIEDVLLSDEIKILEVNHISSEEVSSQIYSDKNKYDYCRLIEDRAEIWQSIRDEYIIFLYCCYVQDREELNMKLKSPRYRKLYKQKVFETKSEDLFSGFIKMPSNLSFILGNR